MQMIINGRDTAASDGRTMDIVNPANMTVGMQTAVNAAYNLTHTYLELGGNDPLIIFGDADLDQAVEESLGGRASNAGQTCCGTKRFLVHRNVYDAYGMKEVEIELFADSVLENQQRLLANNFVPLDRERIVKIYRELY